MIKLMKPGIAIVLLLLLSLSATGQELRKGDKAPEIKQKLITGEKFQLSDLRGKMVLVDFWAGWCKPCRKENPEIVELYHEYKDEDFKNGNGFTIVSVSLDFSPKMWKNAIEQDKLEWPYHVGGQGGWKNPAAKTYNVTSIPQSFLIDGDGTIIGANLRADDLEKILRKKKKGGFLFFRKLKWW